MRKGFTLLELIVVIIIVGILAILGFTQYGRVIEKSRGAEARSILGTIRSLGFAYYLEYAALPDPAALGQLGVGPGTDQIPSACRASHYFKYTWTSSGTELTSTAMRCSGAEIGKPPQGPAALTMTLKSIMATGQDEWGGTGYY